MSGFAGWSFLWMSSSMIASYGQGIVLNIFFGTVVNAAQGIANQVSGQLGAFATTMIKALNPVIAKSEGAGNRDLMIKATITGSKVSFFLLMFLYVPVLIEMPYIFKYWLKNVPDYAVLFCQLLLIRNMIEQIVNPLNSAIAAVGNIRRFQIFSSVLWSLPLLVSYILFRFSFAPYYLYITFIIYSVLAAVLSLYFSHENFNLKISNFLINVVVKCFLSFVVTFLLAIIPVLLMNESVFRLILVIIISTVSFILTLSYIGLSRKERGLFTSIIILIFKKFKVKS